MTRRMKYNAENYKVITQGSKFIIQAQNEFYWNTSWPPGALGAFEDFCLCMSRHCKELS